MTWKDFSIIVLGNERKELNEWARTRNLAYIIYLSNSAEKSPKSLKAFWHYFKIYKFSLPWNHSFTIN